MREQSVILQEGLAKMRKSFEACLTQLHQSLIEMGKACEASIANTYHALIDSDPSYLASIRELEEEIDHMERDIEKQAMQLLLLQAPVASDLRRVSSALRMITDMERIGDQCYDISCMIKKDPELGQAIEDLPIEKMAKVVAQMVSDSVKAFVQEDKALVEKVLQADDEVDDYMDEVHDKIIGKGRLTEGRIDALMVAKYYERIGDHATNIAEWVWYSLTGHHFEQKS